MFKNLVFIFVFLGFVSFGIYVYIKNSIIAKITTEFKTIEFDRVNFTFPNPTINLKLKFNVLNGSNYVYLVKKLNVTIYDNANHTLVGKSVVNSIVPINIGNNEVAIRVENVDFLDNASNYFNNQIDLYIVVEFKILGISIVVQEIVKM
jgi:hypothetical protein